MERFTVRCRTMATKALRKRTTMKELTMLTIRQAALALGIHQRKVYRLANKLGLPKQACKGQTDPDPGHEEQPHDEQREPAQHQVKTPHRIDHCLAEQGEPRANALKACCL